MVSRCCCKYIDFLKILFIATPLVLALFMQQHCYFLVHFGNVFSFLFNVIFVQYIFSKLCSKNIRDPSKIEITWTWRYNYIPVIISTRKRLSTGRFLNAWLNVCVSGGKR